MHMRSASSGRRNREASRCLARAVIRSCSTHFHLASARCRWSVGTGMSANIALPLGTMEDILRRAGPGVGQAFRPVVVDRGEPALSVPLVRGGRMSPLAAAIAAQHLVDRVAAYPENFRGARLVSLHQVQHPQQMPSLQFVQRQ